MLNTVNFRAFCSPRFFSFHIPQPLRAPTEDLLRWQRTLRRSMEDYISQDAQGAAGGERHGAPAAWTRGHACVPRGDRWAWAQDRNSERGVLTGRRWPAGERQNDKEGKSWGSTSQCWKPREVMNTPLVHLSLKKWVSKLVCTQYISL